MKINLPNQLTIARLILSVVFFILLAQYNHRDPDRPIWMLDVAFGVFIIAALTDILDGYLARSRGLVTALGRILDPLADKVLICGAFILFLGIGFVVRIRNAKRAVVDVLVVEMFDERRFVRGSNLGQLDAVVDLESDFLSHGNIFYRFHPSGFSNR